MLKFTDSKPNAVAGYLIFSFIFSILLSLYFKDAMFFAFTLFILMAFILATAIDIGDINKDLANVGWSSTNIETAIPLGIAGGVISLVLGSFVVNINLMHSIVPDLTSVAKMFTSASIVPPFLAVSADLFAQWMVIAPAEESLTKIIAPYAGIKIFGNKLFAFFIAIVLWEIMHVPTFIMQNVDKNMYIVLLILGIVTTILYFITNSILAPIISHSVFNSAVKLSGSVDNYSSLFIIIVVSILAFIWFRNPQKRSL